VTPGLALHHFTLFDLPPEELIAVAAQAGCDSVCLFVDIPDGLVAADGVTPLFATVNRDNYRIVTRALKDSGVSLTNLEFYPLGEQPDFDRYRQSLALGAELGGRLAVVHMHDRQRARAEESLGCFCDIAAEFDLQAGLEFMAPTPGCPDLATALALVGAVARSNLGVAVDLLHAHLTGATPQQVAAIPANRMAYAQVCDTSHPSSTPVILNGDDYMAVAFDRQYPGEGVVPVADYIAALPADTRWDVEVPSPAYRQRGLSALEHARRAVSVANLYLNHLQRQN